MRKILKTIFITTLLFSLLATNSIASSINEADVKKRNEVIFKAQEITDEKVLEERMELGITDDSKVKFFTNNTEDILIEDNSKKFKLNLLSLKSTTQKIKTKLYDDGSKTETYIATGIAEYSYSPVESNSILSDSTEESKTDSSSSVRIFIKVTYDHNYLYKGIRWYDLYDIINTESKVQRLDSMVSLQKLEINGYNISTGIYDRNANPIINQTHYYYLPTITQNYVSVDTYYSNYDGESGYYYNVEPYGSYVSSKATVYCQRAGTSWTHDIQFVRVE